MKKLLCFAVLLMAVVSNGQNSVIHPCPALFIYLDPNQSSPGLKPYVWINQSQPQNVWQIGTVSKSNFTSGSGGAKALVTDTVNPYPANNLSSFELKITKCYPACCNIGLQISFSHRYMTEAGVDGGTVEISTDHSFYQNVIQATGTANGFYSVSNAVTSINAPGFSGNSAGWQYSSFMLESWSFPNDTIWVKFTFGSNGSISGDGWMIGYVEVDAISEGVEKYERDRYVAVSPNPAGSELHLKNRSGQSELTEVGVFDNLGRKVLYFKELKDDKLDVFSLPPGIYSIRYSDGGVHCYSRFAKQ